MKKRFFCGLSALLALVLCLTGCGGSGGNKFTATAGQAVNSSAAMAPEAAPYFPEPEESDMSDIAYDSASIAESPATSAEPMAPPDSRKIILHASMDLETMAYDDAMTAIQQAVAQAGGYIESLNEGGGVSYASRGRYQPERYANIQARVPSDQLDAVMSSMGGLCNVLSQGKSMDDITDSYYDAQARLNTLTIQEERLLAILEKAEKLEDVITLESALSDVRYQIESLTASLRRMDNQVTFSYLNLYLQEVVEYQQIQEKPRTYGDRMREAASDGLEAMVDGLQDFSLYALRVGPSLLVWAVIIAVIVLLIRALAKARAKRRADMGLPPKRPPLVYTTGASGQNRFRRYPQDPPTSQPIPPEDQPKQDVQEDQPK